jgi:hypothetical protein
VAVSNLKKYRAEDFLKKDAVGTFTPSWEAGSPTVTDLPPDFLPAIPPEFAHGASDEFQGLLRKALSEGLDSLDQDDQRRVQAAMEQFPQLAETFRQKREQAEKQPDPKIDAMTKMLQETTIAFGANAHKPYAKQYWESLKVFGKGLNDLLSQHFPGMEKVGDMSLSERMQAGFQRAGLNPIPKGEKTFLIENDQLVERPMPETERVSRNFVRGAIRLAPELMAGFLDNAYDFMTGLVAFPIEEISLLKRAANLDLVNTGAGVIPLHLPPGQGSPYTQEEIEEAIETVKQHPFGVVMLGMMAVHGAKGVARTAKAVTKPKYTTQLTDRAEAFTEDFQKTVDQLATVREHLERAEAIEKGLSKQEQVRASAEGGKLLREQLRAEEAETKTVVTEAEAVAEKAEAMAKAAEDRVAAREEATKRVEREKKAGRKIEADVRKHLKEKGRVDIPEAELGELVRIKQEGTTALREELLSMQEGAKTPIPVAEIARMSRNQLENQISGGLIPLEAAKPKPGFLARVKEELTKKREIEKEQAEKVEPATEEAMRSELLEQAETAKEVGAKFISKDEIAAMNSAELEYYTGRSDISPIRRERVIAKEKPVEGTPEAVAEDLGIRYDGRAEVGYKRGPDGEFLRDAEGERIIEQGYSFTILDPGRKTTITARKLSEVESKVKAKRAAYSAAEKEKMAEAAKKTPEAVAKELGVEYMGLQEKVKRGADGEIIRPVVMEHLYEFKDPMTVGANFTVKNLSEAAADLRTMREAFAVSDKKQREKVGVLEADLSEKQRIVSELDEAIEGLEGAEKKNAEAFALSLKKQIAELEAELIQAKDKLVEMPEVTVSEVPEKPVETIRTEAVQRKAEPMEVVERKQETEAAQAAIPEIGEDAVKKIEAQETKPAKQAERLREETDKAITQKEKDLVEQADKDEAALVEEVKAEPPKPDPETPAGAVNLFGHKKQFEIVPIEDLKVDTERFQGRFEPYSKESVQSIVDAVKRGEFDPNDFDPVHIWRDVGTGDEVILSGHSRLEAMKRVGSSDIAIIRRDFSTEEAAIHWATEQANRMATTEGLRSDIKAFKAMRDRGEDVQKMKARFGRNFNDYDAYSQLDPRGKFLDIIGQRAFADFPHAQKWARAVGELRKQFPELTNQHERQIFDQLYTTKRETKLFYKLSKPELEGIIQDQVGDALWNKNMPIKLSTGYKPKVGARARPDTRRLMEKLDESKKRQSMARTVEEAEFWKAEEKKIKDNINYLVENQSDMFGEGAYELGVFGTPKDYAALLNTAYEGVEGIRRLSEKIGKELTTPPEQLAARMDAREAAIKHHQQVILLDYLERRAARQFDKMIKDPVRADAIRNAIQMPKSEWPGQLTSFEKGVAKWLDEERRTIEKFKLENELVERAVLPPDVEYMMGWYKDTKGRPFKMDWGKFTRSLPQALQKKHKTYIDAEAAGLEPATHNVAEIIFRDKRLAGRAQAGRQLLKTLNQIDAGLDKFITVGKKERPAQVIENWKDVVKAGLTEHYELKSAESIPFLARPIRYKDAAGNSWLVRGPVGVHKAVSPWITEYFKTWEFGSLAKVVGAAKSAKLWGLFHAVQANLSYAIATGRNPVKGLIEGRRLRWADDPIVEGLVEHGLKMEGWKDFEFDPVELFKVHRKDIVGKVGSIASDVWTAPIKLTFHEVVNSLKLSAAYRAFERTWPDWQRRIGPDLSKEQAKSNAFRDAVKFSDNMLSHPDFRYGMLESNKLALKFWYSAAGRKFWYYAMLAPNWLRSHVVAFSLGTKAFVPDTILKNVGAKKKRPIDKLYRQYMYGLGAMYGVMELANYMNTWHMDGEGQFVHENEPGKRLFHVRAPWNSRDGRKEYILMPKTAIEVPKFIYGLAAGDVNLIRGKFNPLLVSAIVNFTMNVDAMGREIIKHRSYLERGLEFLWGGYSPILVSNVRSMMKFYKAPIGSVVSALGFPVSKGYPGGAIGRRIDEFLKQEKLKDQDIKEHVVGLLVDGFEGNTVKDGDKITEAINTMFVAEWSPERIYNVFEKFQIPAMYKWNSLNADQKFSILMAMSKEKQKWFLGELEKEGIVE